jgi:hypothetical protein
MLVSRIAAFLACAVLAACTATTEKVVFVPGAQQQVVPWDGHGLLASRQKITGVGLIHPQGMARTGKWVPFVIEMRNHGKTPIEFRMQDATVVEARPEGDVTVPIKTIDQVLAEEQKRQAMAELVVGSLAYANVSLAQQTRSGGGQARRERREAMEALERQNLREIEFIRQHALQDHTLLPGIHYKAFLLVDPPEPQGRERSYTIRIRLGAELHELKIVQEAPER